MGFHADMVEIGDQAVKASRTLASLTSRKKDAILEAMVGELEGRRDELKVANAEDLKRAEKEGLSSAMLDRLELTDARMDAMIKGIQDVVSLKDPVGTTISSWIRPNGLEIQKVRVPIGVIGMIYESRPNVTVDAATLCFKTSNAVILRGGSESIHSNKALAKVLQEGGKKKGLPEGTIQLVETTDREAVKELVHLVGKVDVIIPRGGEGLIRMITKMSHIPVIKHYQGNCHTYVDESADLEMALEISENAKCQRPGVCNAMETLLVHEKVAAEFLPTLVQRLRIHGVELRGDEIACTIDSSINEAKEDDWYTEYLDLILAIRIVPDVKAAIEHVNQYGSHHSDAIVASSEGAQKMFTQEVDSSTVYVNASTRFTDGAEFGLGAEIGISTDKLHARGPMGLEELTTYKYIVLGKGQIKE
ncbi:MAG: glutamate-5-semialdehyde dehydrogenase [Kiritimatiellae bacterium]|nr:glutamate-5-semialdehyde dehydrogenase [Kiritimatiellia bacterium]